MMKKLNLILRSLASLALFGMLMTSCNNFVESPLVGKWQCTDYGLRINYSNMQMNIKIDNNLTDTLAVAGLEFFDDGSVSTFGDHVIPGLNTRSVDDYGYEDVMRWIEQPDGHFLILSPGNPELSSLVLEIAIFDDELELRYPISMAGSNSDCTSDLFIRYEKKQSVDIIRRGSY